MPTTRIRVDFNARGANGTVRAHTHRADGPVAVGAFVIAYDPDESDMEFPAVVSEFDPDSGRLLLNVAWHVPPGISTLSEPIPFTFSGTAIDVRPTSPVFAADESRQPAYS